MPPHAPSAGVLATGPREREPAHWARFRTITPLLHGKRRWACPAQKADRLVNWSLPRFLCRQALTNTE
ncbi:hypothetical protein SKAU_G00366950 [Synaphobranchus kaupii]|uniref:Uncharacterized protein n=1 Tax=Synaphobranchus kaupii TaxID=118154 RepID=A0A9Q1EFA5_SYNKA|nr:hypothetical protein SKAU_G00366950 [Synaphobranchus kaupii]